MEVVVEQERCRLPFVAKGSVVLQSRDTNGCHSAQLNLSSGVGPVQA